MNARPSPRGPRSRLPAGLAALVLASCVLPSWADRYQDAVAEARAGRYDSALVTLEDLVARHPRRLDYRHDLIAVQSWAERHAQALASSQTLRLGASTPDYVLAAIGKSALGQNDAARAAQAYGLLANRRPGSADAALGAGLALLAASKPAQADAHLRRALRLSQRDVAALQAAVTALQGRGDDVRARPFGERLLALGVVPVAAPARPPPREPTPFPWPLRRSPPVRHQPPPPAHRPCSPTPRPPMACTSARPPIAWTATSHRLATAPSTRP
jgi:biofilm PGA synthesis protein PgaA